jgi:8-oxo-dGTP pyrophosphatase MutT (NUDIX family)
MPSRWEIIEAKDVIGTDVFTLRREVCRHPASGVIHPFYVISVGDWVNVLPLTDEGRVVLVRQWRHGIKDFSVEIPGGMADEGETPGQAAQRELVEETGYGFDELLSLGSVTTNPAIQTNRCWLFLALGARRVGEATPDPTEDIEVLEVDLDEALAMVEAGEIDHTMVVNTFLRLRTRYGASGSEILAAISSSRR